MTTVAVTGASGFIGSAVVASLEASGTTVIRLVRRPTQRPGEAEWDPLAGTVDRDAIAAAGAVVHLAGESIGAKRWTADEKRKVLDSRVSGTATIARALASAAADGTQRVLVSGSAIGYYGLRGDEVLTERSTAGTGFLAQVATEWEAATAPAEDAGVRVVHVRTGIVLGHGGALGRMLPLFRLGLGGVLGSGRQWWSWVSLADEVGIIRHAVDNSAVTGPVNATSPHPATNRDVTRAVARVLRRPAVLRVPSPALALAMGRELTREVIMAGQRVVPEVALATGYRFAHPTLDGALRSVLGGGATTPEG